MDRDTAVKRIKTMQKLGFTPASKEALDLAIEALSDMSEEEVDYCNNCPYLPWGEDCISRADEIAYINRIINSGFGRNKSLDYIRKYTSALPPVAPKPIMTEEVREALMRLSMCAREECSICKHENDCGFDKQVEMATENMNIILNAFDTTPTERTGEWVDGNGNGECSVCGREKSIGWDNYCGYCGAKMKGAENEIN